MFSMFGFNNNRIKGEYLVPVNAFSVAPIVCGGSVFGTYFCYAVLSVLSSLAIRELVALL